MENSEKNTTKENGLQPSLITIDETSSINPLVIDDIKREELLLAILALDSIKGLGFKAISTLFDNNLIFDFIENPKNFLFKKPYERFNNILIELINSNQMGKNVFLNLAKEKEQDLLKKNIEFIPIGHASYPKSLMRLKKPPNWIFVRGDQDLLHSQSIVAVIGTRNSTIDGERLAYFCSSLLAKKNIIVLSGLAKGIDEKAHEGAIDNFGATIAVLGYGIDNRESISNKKLVENIINTGGTIISEYLPDDPATSSSYLRRNELQVAFSKLVIPVECPSLESGTGATIRRAFKISTPVIGVITNTSQINERNLVSTRLNLEKMNIQFFSLFNSHQDTFYEFLRNLIPNHDWGNSNIARQDRFIKKLKNEIANSQKRIELDDIAIDRLAFELKKLIHKHS